MMLSGEMMSILDHIDFSSKRELMSTLTRLYNEVVGSSMKGKSEILQILMLAMQQTYLSDEQELLNYKKYSNKKKGRKKYDK